MIRRDEAPQDQTVQLTEGGCYFLIGYFDDDLRLPSIETFIYLGKNLLGDSENDPRWYFQEAESFVRNGRQVPRSGRDNDDILATPLAHLPDFVDASALATILKELADRAG